MNSTRGKLSACADAGKAEAAISDFFREAGPILQKGAPRSGRKDNRMEAGRHRIDLVIDIDRLCEPICVAQAAPAAV